MYIEEKKLDFAIKNALSRVDNLIEKMNGGFTDSVTRDNRYYELGNVEWTSSFFTGMIFIAYELTGDEKYLDGINKHLDSFEERVNKEIALETHDIGFIYTLSSVAYDKLFSSDRAKEISKKASDLLIKRYFENGGYIRAWGSLSDDENSGRMIIDCNMNLPLLYYTSDITNDKKYYDIAKKHAQTAGKYIVRDDFSTYHTYFFDAKTGEPLRGTTHQGYKDDSCWSRGQAWAIYGFALSYKYTKDKSFLDLSRKTSDYFIEHSPKDKVPFWDFDFDDSFEGIEERDSSAAAIAACGFLELAKYLDKDDSEYYVKKAVEMIESLIDNYSVKDDSADGLILHSVYNKNKQKGVDECSSWGDYYYFEALIRLKKDWEGYF